MVARERKAAADAVAKYRYNERAKPLSPIPIGTPVRIQDPTSKLWNQVGEVLAVGRYRSNRIKFASGSVLWRNRRFIRPMIPAEGIGERQALDEIPSATSHQPISRRTAERPAMNETGSSTSCRPDNQSVDLRRGTRIRKPKIILSM